MLEHAYLEALVSGLVNQCQVSVGQRQQRCLALPHLTSAFRPAEFRIANHCDLRCGGFRATRSAYAAVARLLLADQVSVVMADPLACRVTGSGPWSSQSLGDPRGRGCTLRVAA